MSLKHGILGTNVVRDRHYVRNPATGLNERALLVEPALTNLAEFNIPGGTAADVELQKLDAVTNLAGEFAMRINAGDNRQVTMPGNWDPNNFTMEMWVTPDWTPVVGVGRCFIQVTNGSSWFSCGIRAVDGLLYAELYHGGAWYTRTLSSGAIQAGVPFYLGWSVTGGVSTLFHDTNGDGTLNSHASGTSLPSVSGAWTAHIGRLSGGTQHLEGALNLLITNDGSSADPITDRFNGGAGMALGGDMGWLAQPSGNGLSNAENLVLHIGGNADGSSYQLDTAHNATDLLAGSSEGAYSFSGTGQYIDQGDLTTLNGATKATLFFVVNADTFTRQVGGRYDANANKRQISLSLNASGMPYVLISGDGTSFWGCESSTALSAGSNYAILIVYDGTQATDATKLVVYVAPITNRKIGTWTQHTLTFSGTAGSVPTALSTVTSVQYRVGGMISGGVSSNPFDGTIDDARLAIGKAFTTAERDAILLPEANPAHWTYWWPYDGNATCAITGTAGTVTGATQVADGRHHLGRFERFAKQGQYYTDGVDDKITHGNYSALDGATYAKFVHIYTPGAAPGLNVYLVSRGSLGTDGGVTIARTAANALVVYVPTGATDIATYGRWDSFFSEGVPVHYEVEINGAQSANATRLVVKKATLDTTVGIWSALSTVTASAYSGTIPAALQTVATNTTLTVAADAGGAASRWVRGLHDRFACHAGSIPASYTPYQSGAAVYDIWCDYNGNANNAGLGGATYNGTVTGAIQWYDGRQPEGWTVATGTVQEIDRATGSNQSSEGTWGLRFKENTAFSSVLTKSVSLTSGRWCVLVGAGRETAAAVQYRFSGGGFLTGGADAEVPTQATMAAIGAAGRASVTAATDVQLRAHTTVPAEAYIDNLRALQLATTTLSVSTSTSNLPGIDGKGGAWGVADASSVTASSEGIPLPYGTSLGSTIVKLTSGPAGSGVRRYLFGLPGELNGFTPGEVGVCLVGVYIPASSEIGYADVKLRAADDAGTTDGTAAPGDGEWHWLWAARQWDAGATEAYFELRFADGVNLVGANEVMYMALPSIVQGAGIGAPITNDAEGPASATAADTAYATSASAALASRTYYLRFLEVGTALAEGTVYHLGSGTAGADPRLVIEGVGGYYRVTFDDGSEEITSTATVAPTPGQVVELRITLDATAKTVQVHQAINHGSEVSATASSALTGTFPTALAGTRRYFGSEAGATPGALALLNEASFSGDIALASCRQFAGV